MKEYNKPTQSQALFGLGFMEMIPSPRLGFLRAAFLINQLDFLDRNGLMPSTQSAYRKFHSTETAVTKIYNDLLLAAVEPSI